jgi:hypothetical protein
VSEKKNVRFVRINGRVIPIRMTKDQKDGAKIAATGLGLGAAGGYVAGLKLRKAENISQQTFNFMEDKPFSKLPKGSIDIHDGLLKARTKLKFAKKFAYSSRILASTIAFAGIHKMMKKEKDSSIKEASKLGAAAVASEVVTRGLYSGFSKKSPFNVPLKASTKAGASEFMSSLIKKAFKKVVL